MHITSGMKLEFNQRFFFCPVALGSLKLPRNVSSELHTRDETPGRKLWDFSPKDKTGSDRFLLDFFFIACLAILPISPPAMTFSLLKSVPLPLLCEQRSEGRLNNVNYYGPVDVRAVQIIPKRSGRSAIKP